jgi:hypothetical protein
MDGLPEEGEIDGGVSTAVKVGVGLLGVMLVVGLLGAVGHLVGIGFLGHRLIMYGEGELYVLNLTDEERYVSVDGRPPEVVHAQNAQIVQLIGGRSEVEILGESGEVIEEYVIETRRSHGLINVSERACLAAIDLSSLYGEGRREVELVGLWGPEDRVQEVGSRNVVWPRRDPPPRMDAEMGPMVAVEIVGCPLLEDPGFLKEYLVMRIEDRMDRGR